MLYKKKTQYDVNIEHCKVQKFGAKIELPSKQTTKYSQKTQLNDHKIL